MDDDFRALQQIQEGQEMGLRWLMEHYREPVFRLAFRFMGSEADAAEITQATFVRVWQKATHYRPRGQVKSWIFSIAANLCRDALRRRSFRGRFFVSRPADEPESSWEAASWEADPAQHTVSGEALREIEAAIAALPEKLKLPFIFCVLEGHSYDDCAELIGSNRKTVETRIYRARQHLQAAMASRR